jgi:hypothetical protein
VLINYLTNNDEKYQWDLLVNDLWFWIMIDDDYNYSNEVERDQKS